jgi:hypothetical protein
VERLAVIFGVFIGAVLKECAPVLAEILAEGIRRALRDTVEDGKAPDGLAAGLRARIDAGLRHKDDSGSSGRAASNP